MSAEMAIKIEGLGKRYRFNPAVGGHRKTFREAISGLASMPAKLMPGRGPDASDSKGFWALQDISFEVPRGEVIGVVGGNGAGKSTLLKILSRVTVPTRGRAELSGRIGSMLEVGTGFHQELTGRENVFLSGSILGMSRAEIALRFDRIVEFSGIESFLDTPVKRYSSGMYIRLAFAVAAYLEPEILLVDEVLAVGDSVFQRRCVDRMAELARSGTTLLFVSHNLDLVTRLCSKTALLERGRLVQIGPSTEVVESYIRRLLDDSVEEDLSGRPRRGDGRARFETLSLLNGQGRPASAIRLDDDLRCVIGIQSTVEARGVSLAIVVKTLQGAKLFTSWTDEVGFRIDLRPGLQHFECRFQDVRLRPGRQVAIELWMYDGDALDHIDVARIVDVVERAGEPSGYSAHPEQGPYLCEYEWSPRRPTSH